jgi:hypothetical protein
MHEGLRNDAPWMLAAIVRMASRAKDRDVAVAAARELATDSASKHGPFGAYARTALALLEDPQPGNVDPVLTPLVAADLGAYRSDDLVPIGATPRERVQCVVRWDDVAGAVGMDEGRIARIRVEDLADCVEDDLPDPGEDLLQLTRLAVLRQQPELAYRFAGHGMQSDTRLLPRFLAHRARAVRTVHGDTAATPLVQLLAAAMQLRQDPGAAVDFGSERLLSDVVDKQDGSHDENWFRAELARERMRGDDLMARRESEVTT